MTRSLAGLVETARQVGPAAVRAAARLMSIMADRPASIADLLQAARVLTVRGRESRDRDSSASPGEGGGGSQGDDGRGEDVGAGQCDCRGHAGSVTGEGTCESTGESTGAGIGASMWESTGAGAVARRLWPRMLLGITGAPGSGKSTLVDALLSEYRKRHPQQMVGVIAVDPSSPFTGGAVLGDRVRMMRHATDPKVFIRSLASRGHLGGLTLGVRGVVRVMALIGCDLVLVETVGVGQSEVEVARVADLVTVVLSPGQGDTVQLLKAGLLEIADLFVVNKADRAEAARLHADLLASLSLASGGGAASTLGLEAPGGAAGKAAHVGHHGNLKESTSALDTAGAAAEPGPGASGDFGWSRAQHGRGEPSVFLCSAQDGQGVAALLDGLEALAAQREAAWQEQRLAALAAEVTEAVLEEARTMLHARLAEARDPAGAVEQVLRGEVTVKELACALLGPGSLDQPSRR